jgi:hypothetical protein
MFSKISAYFKTVSFFSKNFFSLWWAAGDGKLFSLSLSKSV